MPLEIRMADGSQFSASASTAKPPAAAPVEASARTRLTIATELDAAERELATARDHITDLEGDVKELSDELRYFGVKRRTKKTSP